MDKYIGCKLIEAEPMDAMEASRVLQRPIDVSNANEKQEGYLVKYTDGYQSWSPKEIFEQAYLMITPNPKLYQDEVSISPQMVEDFIKYVDVETRFNHRTGRRTTVVTVTLVNGFELQEASTCVIDRNYSEELGKEACMGKIKDKIWLLLGFLLQTAVGGVKGGPGNYQVVISINNAAVHLIPGLHTVSSLKQMAGIHPADSLHLDYKELPDAKVIEIHGGEAFRSAPPRGGSI